MRVIRRLLSIAAALVLMGASAAFAAGQMCPALEAQLVALNRGGGSGGMSLAQYDQQLARQSQQYETAVSDARRASCMGGFLFFPRNPAPQCGAIMAGIDRMKANLDRLTAARNNAVGDPFAVSQRRNEILRQLADNQCGDQYAAFGRYTPPRPGGFFGALFGGGPRYADVWAPQGSYDPVGPSVGTYRTLCVRTCDGYYFPISFSTVPSEFNNDQQTCQQMCPGAEVALYTHRNPGEDSEDMVSLSGEAYTALPTAFRYRQQFDAACTCHSATTAALSNYGLTGTLEPAATPVNATPIDPDVYARLVPVPQAKPDLGEDPETLADRAGDFMPKPVAPQSATATAGVVVQTNGKSVRVVGPEYYVAQ